MALLVAPATRTPTENQAISSIEYVRRFSRRKQQGRLLQDRSSERGMASIQTRTPWARPFQLSSLLSTPANRHSPHLTPLSLYCRLNIPLPVLFNLHPNQLRRFASLPPSIFSISRRQLSQSRGTRKRSSLCSHLLPLGHHLSCLGLPPRVRCIDMLHLLAIDRVSRGSDASIAGDASLVHRPTLAPLY